MINKQNLLGKIPDEIGTKDAVHVAIVSVRAGCLIRKGRRFKLNEFNEAIPDDSGFAVADPFRKHDISRGEMFWGLLDQREVPNVKHVWEHPKIKEFTPTRETQKNKSLQSYADKLKMTYEDLMFGVKSMVDGNTPLYSGTLSEAEVMKLISNYDIDEYEVFSEWAGETGHEFENEGSACCPEYDYPDFMFSFKATE